MESLLTTLGLGDLAKLRPRQALTQVLNFGLILSTAFMLWKGLSIASDSSSPIVVVLSGSMEPAFQRGDLLFLWNRNLEWGVGESWGNALGMHTSEGEFLRKKGGLGGTQVGEVVVYNVKGKDIPIVHRVVRRHRGV